MSETDARDYILSVQRARELRRRRSLATPPRARGAFSSWLVRSLDRPLYPGSWKLNQILITMGLLPLFLAMLDLPNDCQFLSLLASRVGVGNLVLVLVFSTVPAFIGRLGTPDAPGQSF